VDFHHPSRIHLSAFIEPTAFRELADNTKGSIFPETIVFEFKDPPFYTTSTDPKPKAALEYGWEPDGSGMIWRNTEKENLRVPITSVRFDYLVLKARYDEGHALLPMQVNAPADRVIEQTALIQTSLAKMSKYLEWITALLVVLAVVMATASYFK
jgi:hypothetical protein